MKHSNGRLFVGLLLIIIGAAFITKNLDLLPWHIEYFYLSWPSYLILVGLIITISARGGFLGPALILVGGIFLFGRINDYSTGEMFEDLWPIFLILFGLSIIFDRRKGKEKKSKKGWVDYEDDSLDISSVFSDNKRKMLSQEFSGAKILTLFGGTELDLSNAKLGRSCMINCDTFFGSTEIHVPSEWKVINKTTSIFGGAEDKRRKSAPVENDDGYVLTIDGFTMFGGIEIK